MFRQIVLSFLLCMAASAAPVDAKAFVKILGKRMGCSASNVIWKGKKYLLTAGHCSWHDEELTADLGDGNWKKVKVLKHSTKSDLSLLEGVDEIPAVKISDRKAYDPAELYTSYTYPGVRTLQVISGWMKGNLPYEMPIYFFKGEMDKLKCKIDGGKVDGEACMKEVNEYGSTIQIEPGSSGGGLLDKNGDLAGVCSLGSDMEITKSFWVPLTDVQEFLSSL